MYLKSLENSNVTYSVDMLRLKTYISNTVFSELEFRFATVWKDYVEANYQKFNCTEFRYNYIISVGEGHTFWFGFLHNSEKLDLKKDKYMFTIEFNPNKIKDNVILIFILHLFPDWYIKSYDVACDIPISILDIARF